MTPCFDVLLPTHNGEAWVGEAIESVLAQTHDAWKLFVIDDCSTDGTRDVFERFRESEPERIQAIWLDSVHRAAGARMVGAARGNGDALTFLDQDDRWLPEKLSHQARALSIHPEVLAVHTDVEIIDSEGRVVPGAADSENAARAAIDWHDPERAASALLANNRIRLVSSAVRRSAFEAVRGFDATLFGGEDWDFWVRVAHTGPILHLPEILLQRRIHDKNVTRVYSYPRALGQLQALRKLERTLSLSRTEVSAKRRRLLRKARAAARAEGYLVRSLRHRLALAWMRARRL